MKKYLFLILLYTNYSFSQKNNDTAVTNKLFIQHDRTYVINKDSILVVYVDSINNIHQVNSLPKFIFDRCFEYNLPIVKGFHSTEDFRWEIINQVTNKNALKFILSNKDSRLKKTCLRYKNSKSSKIINPYSKLSFYDLIRLKYKILSKSKTS